MMKAFKIFSLLLLVNHCYAQLNFKELNDQLFCNVFTYGKADSATNQFLKDNFPYLTKERPQGQIVNAPISINAIEGIVTMKFEKHPFFDFNTIQCRINFQTTQEPGYSKSILHTELYLFFTTKQSADSAFNYLTTLYKSVSKEQSISIQDEESIGRFVGPEFEYHYVPKALLKLSKDGTRGYKIYFRNWRIDN